MIKRLSRSTLSKFSTSTVLGLTFGILLAGYAVFAFDPPVVAPPGGNTLAPVNVGSEPQVKIGGLSVGSLLVEGGIKLGNYSSKPACDPDLTGNLLFDTSENKPYICASGGWKPLDSDNDKDGLVDWFDPNDNSFHPTCVANNSGECFIVESSKSALDGDLIAANIRSGVTIFGVVGTLAVPGSQTFTSGGTFTVPSGVTQLKVSLSAGGGGGGGGQSNTGELGKNGSSGSTSSFGSFASASGGSGGKASGSGGGGGSPSGNAGGSKYASNSCPRAYSYKSGNGGSGGKGHDILGAVNSGGGGGGGSGACAPFNAVREGGGGGGSGGAILNRVISVSPGQNIPVTVGGGGSGGDCGRGSPCGGTYNETGGHGGGGVSGRVVVEW